MRLSSIVFESKGEKVFSVVEISHRMKIVLFYAIVYAVGFDAADFEPDLEVALRELEVTWPASPRRRLARTIRHRRRTARDRNPRSPRHPG